MALDWTPFVEFVREHDRFLLMTHRKPDGDAIGSEVAMADGLRRFGKQVQVAVLNAFPERYRFLDPEHTIRVFDGSERPGAVIILDTGTWNQLESFGEFYRTHEPPTAVVDHHRTQDGIGEVRMIDIEAEAAGRLVYEANNALGVGLSPTSATALFAAVATDTGWFRHANTTARTYELAHELVQAGANPNRIYDALYEQNSPQRLQLIRVALDRLRLEANGRIAMTEIHTSDFAETGTTAADTEDLINLPRGLAGVEIAVIMVEQPTGEVKISFRSRNDADVGSVAEQLGGGGHRLAAGATAPGPIHRVRERLLEVLSPALEMA